MFSFKYAYNVCRDTRRTGILLKEINEEIEKQKSTSLSWSR